MGGEVMNTKSKWEVYNHNSNQSIRIFDSYGAAEHFLKLHSKCTAHSEYHIRLYETMYLQLALFMKPNKRGVS